jgi:hypothetical protein
METLEMLVLGIQYIDIEEILKKLVRMNGRINDSNKREIILCVLT